MTFRVLGPHERGRFAPEAWGHLLALDRLGRAECGRVRAHHRTSTHADRRTHRARRSALPHGGRGIRTSAATAIKPDGSLSTEMATRKRAPGVKSTSRAAAKTALGEARGQEQGARRRPARGEASRPSSTTRARRPRAAARSSSSSRRPRRRRSASTSAAATGCGRPSGTSWICPRRSSASTSRRASRPSSCRSPARKRRSPKSRARRRKAAKC